MLASDNSPTQRQTHYDVLQIAHTATIDQIKAAYRSLIIGCHPDKLTSFHSNDRHKQHASYAITVSETLSGIDLDDAREVTSDEIIKSDTSRNYPSQLQLNEVNGAKLPRAEYKLSDENAKTFHEIQAAYHCLRDPDKRREYDETMSRTEEREEWNRKGASTVKLSDMECDWCCVVDEENPDSDEDTKLQKVFFHPCRCGDTFQVFLEELMESFDDAKNVSDMNILFSNRVWQCESCSLTIQIEIDIKIDE